MNKFQKRVEKRETAIKLWLSSHGYDEIMDSTYEALNTIAKHDIRSGFYKGIDRALNHIFTTPSIMAIDFSWYFASRETGEALAYAYDGVKTKGTLAKSDVGPKELPGIEIKAQMGGMVDEYFAALPTDTALNMWVNVLKPKVLNLENSDVRYLTLDLVRLWNYKIALEVFDQWREESEIASILERPSFWVLLTQHERNPLPLFGQ